MPFDKIIIYSYDDFTEYRYRDDVGPRGRDARNRLRRRVTIVYTDTLCTAAAGKSRRWCLSSAAASRWSGSCSHVAFAGGERNSFVGWSAGRLFIIVILFFPLSSSPAPERGVTLGGVRAPVPGRPIKSAPLGGHVFRSV